MIYKLNFEEGNIEWVTAKSQFHALKSYHTDITDISLDEIEGIEEITDEEAKNTMVRNSDFDEDNPDGMPEFISLYDLGGNTEDFSVIASNQDF
jgi:hypothetical protein